MVSLFRIRRSFLLAPHRDLVFRRAMKQFLKYPDVCTRITIADKYYNCRIRTVERNANAFLLHLW
jgi:hypothetical protein